MEMDKRNAAMEGKTDPVEEALSWIPTDTGPVRISDAVREGPRRSSTYVVSDKKLKKVDEAEDCWRVPPAKNKTKEDAAKVSGARFAASATIDDTSDNSGQGPSAATSRYGAWNKGSGWMGGALDTHY